jgi:hypothetical protein
MEPWAVVNAAPGAPRRTSPLFQVDKTKEKEGKEKKKEKKDEEEKKKGTLEEFEAEAMKPDSSRSSVTVSTVETEEDESMSWWIYPFAALVVGGVGSWYRVTGHPAGEDSEELFGRRQTGALALPFASLNLSYQSIESDVEARDARVEGGFGPFAVHYRFTRFNEEVPETQLDLSWLHGVLRLSYFRYVEIGLGFGWIAMKGADSDTGGSFTLPVGVDPSKFFGFDFRPTWGGINGHTVSDYDLALRVGIRYVAVRGGYRWTTTGGSTLKGPIVGLMVSY